MFYTITLNPSVDYYTSIDQMRLGGTTHTSEARFLPGGKGINVSIILDELKEKHIATGFLGGFTGQYIEHALDQHKCIQPAFITIDQETRMNIKLKLIDGEAEINHIGPNISELEEDLLFDRLNSVCKDDVLIISGSAPKSHGYLFKKIAQVAKDKNAILVIDTPSEYYDDLITFKPTLLKPNQKELEDYFKVKLHTEQDIIYYGKRLIDQGIQYLMVSLGNRGSILLSKDYIYRADPIPIDIRFTIGAGDSMVAGFMYKYMKSHDVLKSYEMAVACATATAASPSLAKRDEISDMLKRVQIKTIKS